MKLLLYFKCGFLLTHRQFIKHLSRSSGYSAWAHVRVLTIIIILYYVIHKALLLHAVTPVRAVNLYEKAG